MINKDKKLSETKAALILTALGVVFGDIGTSPLYALRECFAGPHSIPISAPNVLGAVSLIFWFLVILDRVFIKSICATALWKVRMYPPL